MNTRIRTVLPGLLVAAAGAAACAPLAAAEYWLQAQETTRTVAAAAGPETITMWEYARCDSGYVTCTASAPGPLLRVPAGEGLTIHLRNNLVRAGNGIVLSHVDAYGGAPVPTSLHVAGLPAPTFNGNPAAVVTFGNGAAARIRSFTSEVANGVDGIYSWSAAQLRPGSYVYQSGTHPQVQVQMGLYGGLVVEAPQGAACTPRCAYDGVGYDHEVVVVYSETDPVLHAQVAADTYGDAGAGAKTSTILYDPQYFFVDGEVDGPVGGASTTPNTSVFTSLDARVVGQSGDRVLLRLLNAGLETHSPFLQGARFAVVGEDGAAYPAATRGHRQYSVLLPAGKGLDALWIAGADGTYPLLEHRRLTAHAAPAAGTAAASGALVRLEVGIPAGVPVALADSYVTDEDTPLAAASVLANDPCSALVAPDVPCSSAAVVAGSGPSHGNVAFNADGTFTYTPALNYNGPDSFKYTASNGLATSAQALVTITVNPVNDAPVANADGPYDVATNVTTTLAPALVANDTDIDGDALVVAPAGGATAHGTWTAAGGTAVYYTPEAGYEGPDAFQYQADDGKGGLSAPATVTLNVMANLPPVARDDAATIAEDSGPATIDVLANDSDPSGDVLAIQSFTQPAGGAVAAGGGGLVFTPNLNFNGVATFTYTIVDAPAQGTPKTATATVRVTVTPVNDPPVAVNDLFSIADDASTTVAAPGVLANDSDVDGDALTAVMVTQPANATISLAGNGGFTIASPANFNGTATFSYQARDAAGALSNVATATVNVTAAPFQVLNGGVQFATASNRYSASGGVLALPPGRTLTFRLLQPGSTTGPVLATTNVTAARTWSFSLVRADLVALPGATVRVTATGLAPVTVPVIFQ